MSPKSMKDIISGINYMDDILAAFFFFLSIQEGRLKPWGVFFSSVAQASRIIRQTMMTNKP